MKKEKNLLGNKNAPITAKTLETKEFIRNGHNIGVKAAKRGALFGAGISIGSNTVEVIRGDKEIGEAIVDVTIDTAIAGATGYVAGAAGSLIASTSVGSAAIGAMSTGVGTLAGTSGGAAIIGAIGTASTGIAAASAAVTGTVVTGAATVATTLGATATGAAIMAGAGAVTAATIAAAPIIAGGIIIGGITSFIGSLFD